MEKNKLLGIRNLRKRDAWVAQLVKRLPSAQVMIPASYIQLLRLPLPTTLYACARSLSLSNK